MRLLTKTLAMVNQEEQSAIKLILILTVLFFTCCKPTKPQVDKNKDYEIKRYEANGVGNVVVLRYFDHENHNRPIPYSFAIVNDIMEKDSIIQVVARSVKLNLKISVHAKETILIENLEVGKGDSIVVNAYLRDSKTIFH